MQQSFNFLGLPVEVRVQVYRLFFSGHPRSITYPMYQPVSLIEERHWQLLLVSKCVYHEALAEYYRTCIFGLYTLELPHLEKLIRAIPESHFANNVTNLLLWKVPEPKIFEAFQNIKWVKLIGITCGVELDPFNGQIFTYYSLLRALRQSHVPGFSWNRCQVLFERYPAIEFMLDVRYDFVQVRLDASGLPQRKWIKTVCHSCHPLLYSLTRDRTLYTMFETMCSSKMALKSKIHWCCDHRLTRVFNSMHPSVSHTTWLVNCPLHRSPTSIWLHIRQWIRVQ